MENSALKKLKKILSACNLCISYYLFSDETDPMRYPLFDEAVKKMPAVAFVPKDPSISPISFAESLRPDFQKTAFIFIPGRRFDSAGARQGRGNGWYDRFLSAVPKKWIRIGVTNEKYFSLTPLFQNKWDEPMDWVVCEKDGSWTIYETEARKGV